MTAPCKWSREIFEINNKAGLNAVHVTLVYHEDYDELQQRINSRLTRDNHSG